MLLRFSFPLPNPSFNKRDTYLVSFMSSHFNFNVLRPVVKSLADIKQYCKQWRLVVFFAGGGQVFEKLGVVENILGSHTPKKITLDSIIHVFFSNNK